MALDQVPTDERTAPQNPSQVPLETGQGRVICLTLLLCVRPGTVMLSFVFYLNP